MYIDRVRRDFPLSTEADVFPSNLLLLLSSVRCFFLPPENTCGIRQRKCFMQERIKGMQSSRTLARKDTK